MGGGGGARLDTSFPTMSDSFCAPSPHGRGCGEAVTQRDGRAQAARANENAWPVAAGKQVRGVHHESRAVPAVGTSSSSTELSAMATSGSEVRHASSTKGNARCRLTDQQLSATTSLLPRCPYKSGRIQLPSSTRAAARKFHPNEL